MKNPETDQPYPDDWDDLFRQRFAEFQSEPSANALVRILASLPRARPAFDRRKAWVLGSLGFLLLLGGFWFVSQRPSPVSTQLTTKSTEVRRPTNGLLEQTRDAANTPQIQSSSKAGKPLANEATPKAVTPNNQNVASSDGKVVNESEDKTGVNAENKPRVDSGNKTEVVSRKEEALASATRKVPSPTNEKGNAIAEKVIATVVGANRPKTIGKTSRNSPQSTALAGIANSARSNKALLTSKSRASEVGKRVEMDKSSALPQQNADSPALPQTEQQLNQEYQLPASQAVSLPFLTTQPIQISRLNLLLPDITLSSLPQSAPQQPAMSRKRPAVFIGVMPLFTYQQIAPVATDAVWVKNVRSQSALSSHRAGLRLQAGVEWPLSQRISLRTSLIYNQLNQQVSYTTPSEKPDSIRIERVDDKTVRLTPYYSDAQMTRQTNWHYVGIGSDLVWQLGKLGAWRHYASAGASVGAYLAQEASQTTQPLSGFVQAAYGIERPITPSVWLRIAPTVQYGLSTISDADGLFHIRPYTYGITIGLRK